MKKIKVKRYKTKIKAEDKVESNSKDKWKNTKFIANTISITEYTAAKRPVRELPDQITSGKPYQ